jgi:hypothetical protein
MSRGAFRSALRESRLLEKAASWIQPFGWLLAFRGANAKAKSQTKHTLLLPRLQGPYALIQEVRRAPGDDTWCRVHDDWVTA